MTEKKPSMGLWSGVGLVVANMIGVGVLTSTGYMSGFSPAQVLRAWVIGGVMAMAGARSYAAIAQQVPRSGGEYTYLSELLHPSLGYLAGWTSLLVGFAAPMAADAFAAGTFSETLFPGVHARVAGACMIVGITAWHAVNLRASRFLQNALVAVKILLLVGFVVCGVVLGSHVIPEGGTRPPFQLNAYLTSLFFIAYAYSGWNAAIYAASEFRDPKRNVPRAMLIGTAMVMLLYLAVNVVFLANLTPARFENWMAASQSGRITVAHLVVQDLVGKAGAVVASTCVIFTLFSAMSAMTMLGPRVFAQMAEDGFLPRGLAAKAGKPPVASLLVQGAIALALLFSHSFEMLMVNVGMILIFTSALTVVTLFRVQLSKRYPDKPGAIPLLSAMVYIAASSWMLYAGFKRAKWGAIWVGSLVVIAGTAYLLTRRLGVRPAPRAAEAEKRVA